MIIDCHTHIFPEKIRNDREAFCKRDGGFSSIYKNLNSKMVGVEELIASMNEAGVDCSIVCGFPWNEPDLCSLHNQYLMEVKAKYPDRLIVFISLPLSTPKRSEEEFEQRIREGAMGVGEIAFYEKEMDLQAFELTKPILSQMERQGIPLLLHTNETIGHSYPGKGKTSLERFYRFAVSFPNLPIIFGHWGGGLPFYELMPEVARGLQHVYYDTAASPFLYSSKIYTIVKEIVGVERILFGSDYPLIRPQRYFEE
ncbi:MAG: amidohydrolase family protein, partial [Thermodesulfobacteriota bacterium]